MPADAEVPGSITGIHYTVITIILFWLLSFLSLFKLHHPRLSFFSFVSYKILKYFPVKIIFFHFSIPNLVRLFIDNEKIGQKLKFLARK